MSPAVTSSHKYMCKAPPIVFNEATVTVKSLTRVQPMKRLITLSSTVSCYLVPLRPTPSYTLSPCSSLSVRDQVSHPYKTTGITAVLSVNWRKM